MHALPSQPWTYIHYTVFNYISTYLFIYAPRALCWTLAVLSVSWSFTQSGEFLERRISPSQGRYLHIGQHKQRINAHRDIHASSGIRTHDTSVWAGGPRDHCDRQLIRFTFWEMLSSNPTPWIRMHQKCLLRHGYTWLSILSDCWKNSSWHFFTSWYHLSIKRSMAWGSRYP
jgi:hypothetical protein